MEAQKGGKRRLVLGIFAQVDAGKTTLSEALLYKTGALRTLGRVDHGDAHLDTHELERARGITIFSKQARFETEHLAVTLLDTPGHADFAPEAERVMPVIDCALLLVSGTDGVQGHTLTLWRLLQHYGVPVVLFFNKMDLPGADRPALLADARTALSDRCAALDDAESVALSSEALLEHFLNTGALDDALAADAVAKRELFPCLFGSARQLDGIDELLQALERLAPVPVYPAELSARVYQIAHDLQGNRLTFLKVTGGTLAVRSAVRCHRPDGEPLEAKVTQLRLYSGAEFEAVQQVPAGDVCAALGLSGLLAGDTLGDAAPDRGAALEPVMSYCIRLPADLDPQLALPKLRLLEEEEPQLRMVWDARLREIRVQLMGAVQLEILQSLIRMRFGWDVTFDTGRISYRETIAAPVEGVGHFEPLRHYAEVHLILAPLPQGSGLVFDSYRVRGGTGSRSSHNNLRVVYTQEDESADLYIETLVGKIGKNYAVRVATSDALIQLSALRSGVLRVSAAELERELERTNGEIAAVLRRLREEARHAAGQESPLRALDPKSNPDKEEPI